MTQPHAGAFVAQAFGTYIVERVAERDWTIADLAERADIATAQFKRMLEGADAINTDHIAKVSTALSISPADLLEAVAWELPGTAARYVA